MPVCTYLLGPSEDEAEESVMECGASLSGQSAVRLVYSLPDECWPGEAKGHFYTAVGLVRKVTYDLGPLSIVMIPDGTSRDFLAWEQGYCDLWWQS